MDAVILVNHDGDVIIEKYYKEGIPKAVIKPFLSIKNKGIRVYREIPAVIDENSDYPLVHFTQNGKIYFVAVVNKESNVIAVLEFLSQLNDLISHYIGDVNIGNIQKNFSTVSFLLEETVDHSEAGQLQPDVLKLVIPPPSVVSKVVEQVQSKSASILSAAWNFYKQASGTHDDPSQIHMQQAQMQALEKVDQGFGMKGGLTGAGPDLWYRGGDIKYNTNEIYCDVVDDICGGFIDAPSHSGAPSPLISIERQTRIEINSKLSGIPECRLHIKDLPTLREHMLFHPCALHTNAAAMRNRSIIFGPSAASSALDESDRAVIFTPPEGSTLLATVVYPETVNTNTVSLPFIVSVNAHCGADSCKIHISIRPSKSLLSALIDSSRKASTQASSSVASNSKSASPIEGLLVNLPLPSFIMSSAVSVSQGEAEVDATPGKSKLTWRIPVWDAVLFPKISLTVQLPYLPNSKVAEGQINAEEIESVMELCCNVIPLFSCLGGVKVELLEIKNVDYQPFKGCKYSSRISGLEYRVVFDGRVGNVSSLGEN